MMLVIWLLGWPLVSTYTIQQEAKLGRTYDSKKVNLANFIYWVVIATVIGYLEYFL